MANAPYIMLVDDDEHSAHLMIRMLTAHGAPAIEWQSSTAQALSRLRTVLASAHDLPGLVIVDIKAHSGANLEFVASIATALRMAGVPMATMMPTFDGPTQAALRLAGVGGIFYRQADRDDYRREAASIVSFWARQQRLDAVGM